MKADLSGPLLKIDRAEHHLNGLKQSIESFTAADPYEFRLDSDLKSTHYLLRAHIREEPPTDWGLMVGDFAHNARSALDLLVYGLSTLPAQDKRRMRISFPIFAKPTDYRAKEAHYLSGVESHHREAIESAQPYQDQQEPHDDHLILLADLNNTNKHRVIPVVSAVGELKSADFGPGMIGQYGWTVSGKGGVKTADFSYTILNRGIIAEDGAAVAEIRTRRPLRLDIEPKIDVTVKFGQGGFYVSGRPMLNTLGQILERVKQVVGSFK